MLNINPPLQKQPIESNPLDPFINLPTTSKYNTYLPQFHPLSKDQTDLSSTSQRFSLTDTSYRHSRKSFHSSIQLVNIFHRKKQNNRII